MAMQQLLKIVYALDIKFWVRWCTCSMWYVENVTRKMVTIKKRAGVIPYIFSSSIALLSSFVVFIF